MNLHDTLLVASLVFLFSFITTTWGVYHIMYSHPEWYKKLKGDAMGKLNILHNLCIISALSLIFFGLSTLALVLS